MNKIRIRQNRIRWSKAHPELLREYSRRWYAKNPEWQTGKMLYRKFGVSKEAYFQKLASQQNACAICVKPASMFSRRLAVDHDHQRQIIRGLLCIACNTKLAALEDSHWKYQAEKYLEKYLKV